MTLLNPRPKGTYASFGAHPRFEVALERALTELLQGRADRLAGFSEPSFDLEKSPRRKIWKRTLWLSEFISIGIFKSTSRL